MAILDDTLAGLVAGLTPALTAAGLSRQRGGVMRGTTWAECSGRLADGSWGELRIHHKPTEHLVQAGLLAYQPLSRGGRTVVVGECSLSYRNGPEEVTADVSDEIARWLTTLATAATKGA